MGQGTGRGSEGCEKRRPAGLARYAWPPHKRGPVCGDPRYGRAFARLFNLSRRGNMSGARVGRELGFQVGCMLGDDGTYSLSTD